MKLQQKKIDLSDNLSQILKQLNEYQICKQLEQVDPGDSQYLDFLVNLLVSRKKSQEDFPNYIDGLIYEYIYKNDKNILCEKFKGGLLSLVSENDMYYQDLQELLINKNYLDADVLTQQKLKKLAKLQGREWLYFTDIRKIPSSDLLIIDKLWRIHSLDKFGFSIQRTLWLSVNKDWNELWEKIGWKSKEHMSRYPNEFIWDINAPKGHLPLFNQLRGVHVLSELFNHVSWNINN
uniref:Conserved hypothetical plastid protein n=1 Tax=Porphyridium purpureum TaxID=35688 RepID=W0RZ94_PORPP|nr:conserved hypothetical plastid protein [Porphyridium purpureum]ATJ02931.1 hypothetical protein [Porphyridium purpureum]BAO23710.1 conserved hypothetical plastid protein [Porphyridium purpureum]